MSAGNGKRPPGKGSSAGSRDGLYRVGYGKPPAQHQFKPGQSGNGKGRPKGSKSTDTLLKSLLDKKIEIRVNGRPRLITVREAILTRFAEDALKGNTKSAAFLLHRYDFMAGGPDQDHATSEDEQEIIQTYLASFLKQKGLKL
jgi:hypothetical protein